MEGVEDIDNPREWPRREKVEWNSSDYCSKLDNRRFEEHCGQWVPSISQIDGEGTSRYMIQTSRSSNNVWERKLRDEV
jgi:hypothetical protein